MAEDDRSTARRSKGQFRGAGLSEHPGMFLVQREARMPERAFRMWDAAREGRAIPRLTSFAFAEAGELGRCGMTFDLAPGPGDPPIAFVGSTLAWQMAPSSPMARALAALLDQLRRRCVDIGVRRAPHMFEVARADAHGAGHLCRGVLLPLARADGETSAIFCVLVVTPLAMMGDRPDVRAAVGAALRAIPSSPSPSPWGSERGAESLLQARDDAAPHRDIGVARTWAALAAVPQPRRAKSLHAALGAACDLLSRRRYASLDDEPVARWAERAVADVFGADIAPSERRDYVAVLAHGVRLGLSGDGLASLLDRTPDGVAALARAERDARCGRRAPFPAGGSRGGEALVLLPLDANWRRWTVASERVDAASACPRARAGA